MKFFSKNEMKGVGIILTFIVIASLVNFSLAERRARDAQRKVDLGTIYNALGRYHQDFGFFPLGSLDGKIKACQPDDFEALTRQLANEGEFNIKRYLEALFPCEWGKDALADLSDDTYPAYLKTIPTDPKQEKNISYFYFSNGRRFQIYAYLEGEETEAGFSREVIARNIACGEMVCNFGRAFGETPLDKSLQEYENELLEKIQNSK